MRITGGMARSISINCPRGDWVRPATDRMREAVFSSLGEQVTGCRFLDLYAGAGCYGLEAVSRGALSGSFVEVKRAATTAIEKNLKQVVKSVQLPIEDHSRFRIHTRDVSAYLNRPEGADPVNLVFIDPPYDQVDRVFGESLKKLIPFFEGVSRAIVLFESAGELKGIPEAYRVLKVFGKDDTRCTLLEWTPM